MDGNRTHTPVDPGGLMEFSVVFTDRSLNSMSRHFQGVMRDLSAMLCDTYGADGVAIVPGGGTYGMEAVARQFGRDAHCMIVRNGWFSYRWSQIFDAGDFAAETTVKMASRTGNDSRAPYAPVPIAELTQAIRTARPDVVFAPHVETSAGMILPDDYLTAAAAAAHEVGALFVLDCIASGCIWVDMQATGVDVLISAPQKGWSATPCAGLVMMSQRALDRLDHTTSNSFANDLAKWRAIMKTYEDGGHAYHATMPTDGLVDFHAAMIETRDFGLDRAKAAQWELGDRVRAHLAGLGIASVAAPGFQAPGVVVSYTDNPDVKTGAAFAAEGMQIAAGVPLQVGEPADFMTFRLGLFGLDKLYDVQATLNRLTPVLDRVLA
ncbi:aminotransferase class V-fold PLP-dependent enzyme [Loktanella sp. SALINAS62]|uniref:aminotransferase class V-fold PLP-dependent enzyme n=1 Tax=Loktanella sp. SALINAS62 TaxID=2706124 RepID=UPI001B8BC3F3|nr:aminotransferase class V-fold PLP-dependent enzyme [Loktanella sp. SALINAS62]MBS1302985.1 alanine--glyoxylate aminotransferase family protein [Loktanella sp. SALINAS62]